MSQNLKLPVISNAVYRNYPHTLDYSPTNGHMQSFKDVNAKLHFGCDLEGCS